ncbi:sensor domain-containing diguanylate cyclase [Marinobacter daepoensis]|uniref:sensor domain-containing diguanylate cyclase n=1 Tax=Marinobacter daepoensis TaxID=262077 RepID=UPI001C942E28|nr:sensor domain-containing diguanylate cyclase [Marinobacter daepoensis]MBY6032647.1 sensor domain-containing diguanylate cyclase [Marinobacter daepoensis]
MTLLENMAGSGRHFRKFLRSVLVLGITVVLVFTGIVFGTLEYRAGQELEVLKARERARVQLTSWLLTQAFDHAASDVQAFVRMPSTLAYNQSRSLEDRQLLTQDFGVQLAQKPTYSQLRFIGIDGSEKVRLDRLFGRVLVTPERQLQSKAGRYYFTDSRSLSDGELYVSPLDLNVENGVVDAPYLPTVRFAVPLTDQPSGRRGLVVLNVGGELLLDTFRFSMTTQHQAFLLNSEGYILHGPDRGRAWGFMFGLPPAFASDYPEAWAQVQASDSGELLTEDGLFLYETVYPLERIAALPAVDAGTATADSYFWKTVTFVPREHLPGTDFYRQPGVMGGYLAGVVLLLALLIYFRFSHFRRQQLRREIVQQARRFRDISSVLGEGLIVMDRAGLVTYVNPEAERILGWPREELENRKGHQVFHVHEEDESQCPILLAMTTQTVYRSKTEVFRRKDGVPVPVSLNAAPLSDDAGAEGVVISFQDFSEIKNYQDEIQRLAYQDTLTGLPNRRVLDERLALALGMSDRHDRCLALMFLDLDHFKAVNDTYGHDAGDQLLKEIARRISTCVRKTDTVVRMGGDEFIILLQEVAGPESAERVAAKILEVVAEPVVLTEGKARVGVSIGIAIAEGQTVTPEQLMEQADSAMYEAKRAGKNQYYVWG